MSEDIRWQQRFENFNKALSQLKKFIDKKNLNELEEQGLIKAFEYTYDGPYSAISESVQGFFIYLPIFAAERELHCLIDFDAHLVYN